jgi:ABC-type transport system involved in multi-copper enzyme maturation permease subunit
VVATNDFDIFWKKKYVVYSLIGIPVTLSIGLPLALWLLMQGNSFSVRDIEVALNAFSFLFILLASVLPTILASYSFVGEKLEKNLEPLLATPTTDGELLLGKGLAAFLPSILTTYLGSVVYMGLADRLTRDALGAYYFPNWNTTVILLAAVPIACTFSVGVNIIISSLVSDLRAAQQLGILVLLPVGGLYVLAERDFVSLEIGNIIIISILLLIADALLFYVSKVTFRREEILTKWK